MIRGRGEGRKRRAIVQSLIAIAASLLATTSSATPSAKLTYLRGPGAERCPDEAELKKAVAARLGYDVFFPWAKTTVIAEISRETKGFSGKVRVVDEHAILRGERAIVSKSDDCADVVRALALAISIAVDDFGLDDVPAPAPPAEVTPAPAPEPEPVKQGDREPEPVDRTQAQAQAQAQEHAPPKFAGAVWFTPIVSFGIAPSAAVGAQLAGEARYRSLSLGVEARGDLPASTTAASGGQIRTNLVAGSIAPCLRAPSPFFVCALLTVGDFHEAGASLASPRSGSAVFGGLGPRIGVDIHPFSRLFFIAHADGLFTFARHVVQIDGAEVFTIAPTTASLGIGAGVRL